MAQSTQVDETVANFINQLPDQALEDIIANVQEGARTPAAALGFDEGSLNHIERMALGYYRARHYDKAALIYGFILNLDNTRSTTWRGLAAVAQARKLYNHAVLCYEHALRNNPKDTISKVLLGECLCQIGQTEGGLRLLKELVKEGTKDPVVAPYLARAQAIIGADGGLPNRYVLMQQGKSLSVEATKALKEQGFAPIPGDTVEYDPDSPLTADDMLRNPEMRKTITDLKEMLGDGRLSWKQVGGFTDNEMSGAYACAAKYAEMGQVMEALQITGYLMFLDPYDNRYFQLAGICLQRLKQYEPAEHYYRMALTLDKADVRSQVYMGECMIMAGRIDDGINAVRKGIQMGEKKPDAKDLIDRGKVLIKQFARA